MKRAIGFLLTILTVVALSSSAIADDTADSVLGLWHSTGDKCIIKIFKRDSTYCGEIVSLAKPNFPANDKLSMGGKPRIDRRNPDPALRNRPIAGLEFMTNFVYAGKNKWEGGKIYDPESGSTYKSKMTLISTNQLEVRGYIGISLIGRTVTWTR